MIFNDEYIDTEIQRLRNEIEELKNNQSERDKKIDMIANLLGKEFYYHKNSIDISMGEIRIRDKKPKVKDYWWDNEEEKWVLQK